MKAVRSEQLKVLTATLLLEMSWSMSFFFVTFKTYEEGSFIQYALIRGLPAITYFLGSRFYGFISDSTGSRRIFMIIGATSTTMSLLGMAATPTSLWILIVCVWYFLTAFEPVTIAYLSTEKMGGEASGEYYAASELGFTLGSAIGGFLTDLIGIRYNLLLATAISVPSILLFLSLREDGSTTSRVEIKEALYRVFRLEFPRGTRKVILPFFLASLSLSTFYAAFSIKVYEASSRSNTLLGVLVSLAGLFSTVLGPIYGKLVDRLGGKRSFAISCIIYSLYFLAGVIASDILILAILMVLPLFPLHYTSRNALAMELLPEEKASAVSVPSSLGSIAEATGNYISGVTMTFVGPSGTMLLGPLLSITAVLILLVRKPVG